MFGAEVAPSDSSRDVDLSLKMKPWFACFGVKTGLYSDVHLRKEKVPVQYDLLPKLGSRWSIIFAFLQTSWFHCNNWNSIVLQSSEKKWWNLNCTATDLSTFMYINLEP